MGSARKLRILSFNRHEPVMYELAKTGHEFGLLLVDRNLWTKEWDLQSRPIPANVEIVGKAENIISLDLGQYDLLLAQTYDDFEVIERFPQRKAILLHTAAALPAPEGFSRAEALRRLYQEWQLASIPVVYVSHYVAQNWGLPGRVVLHCLDIRDYESFRNTGRVAAVLTVAHFFKEREELGHSLHQQVVGDHIPYRIVGHNPSLPDAKPAKDWDELKGFYRDYRVYLNTTTWGGSLAMLEAMAAAMPVVTTPRPPGVERIVVDGHNGYTSADPDELRDKVEFLLTHPDIAKAMGQNARETVVRKYGIERFLREWQEIFEDAVRGCQGRSTQPVGNLPEAYYDKANLIPDNKGSLGKGLIWSVDGPGEAVLYGPFIHLPAADYKVEFYLRLGVCNRLARWMVSRLGAQLTRIDARGATRNEPVAVVDVCCGSDGQVRASRVLRVSDFRPWSSYQGFKLTFHANGEKLFQFRVFATGSLPVYVDPYRTWASIEALDGKA